MDGDIVDTVWGMLDPSKEGSGMSWQESTIMSQRRAFVARAQAEDVPMRALCRAFGISPTTGYTWLARAEEPGADLTDRSRRPHASPHQTSPDLEARVLALRTAHPAWGGRKLRQALVRQGVDPVPAASTITAILHRHNRIAPAARPQRDLVRFVAAAPNDLWQMDWLGYPRLPAGHVYPLTVLDDHSRFLLAVVACSDQRLETVQAVLTALFRQAGLPARILADNGPPWGAAGAGSITALEAWLRRLGITVTHGRPRHPQTQGKLERTHRTLRAELPGSRAFPDLASAQAAFDAWRQGYNEERPHDALDGAVPAEHYVPSPRPFPEQLPPLVYAPGALVRKVFSPGRISFRGQEHFVGWGLVGQSVAVRPTADPHRFTVWYGPQVVTEITLGPQP
jgi:transposase InsO family protein